MADPFYDDESSIEASLGREAFSIVAGATTYNVTSGNRDLVLNGVLYTAIPVMRGEVAVPKPGVDAALELTIPVNHPIVQRYFQLGVPPRKVTVTVYRQQKRSGLIETIWAGDVTSVAVSNTGTETSAKLRVPSKATETMQRVLPTVTCGRTCGHILYDKMCAIARTGSSPSGAPFKTTATIMILNGRDIRIDLSSVPAGDAYRSDWLVNGELVHTVSGERMTIRSQKDPNPGISTVTDISIQLPIPGMQSGDSVDLYAGCSHAMAMCNGKFANRQRFGGFNRLPKQNVFKTHSGRLFNISQGEV